MKYIWHTFWNVAKIICDKNSQKQEYVRCLTKANMEFEINLIYKISTLINVKHNVASNGFGKLLIDKGSYWSHSYGSVIVSQFFHRKSQLEGGVK